MVGSEKKRREDEKHEIQNLVLEYPITLCYGVNFGVSERLIDLRDEKVNQSIKASAPANEAGPRGGKRTGALKSSVAR